MFFGSTFITTISILNTPALLAIIIPPFVLLWVYWRKYYPVVGNDDTLKMFTIGLAPGGK